MNTASQRLAAVLDQQIRCAEAMLETLANEGRALADGDQAALALATDAKAKVVAALEQLETERRALSSGKEPVHAEEWRRLRELIQRCKEQNQRNGALLQARAENGTIVKTVREVMLLNQTLDAALLKLSGWPSDMVAKRLKGRA